MADVTSSAAEIVNEKWDMSIELANQASQEVSEATENLANLFYKPATISVQWNQVAEPPLEDVSQIPTLPDIALALPDGMPGNFTGSMAPVVIDDFTGTPPEVNYGVAPTVNIGTVPVLPEVRDVVLPDAPVVLFPDSPDFLTLSTHAAPSINLHEDWLDKLKDIPELQLLEPAPFTYAPGARYASQLLDTLKATLQANLTGSTGLVPEVEQAIWSRELDKETAVGLAREQEVLRGAESLGYPLPVGVVTAQFFDATRQKLDQAATRARDMAIQAAQLEQTNRQNAIQAAQALESTLMDDSYRYEMLIFQSAKEAADNAIAAHNARIQYYQALLDSYRTYASIYDTLIKAELSKISVFQAMLDAEKLKADINQSLVNRYKVEIDARMARVEIYKAQVGAAQTLVELERTRIQAGAEQIKGFVATVNAETAKIELYKVQLEGEKTKVEVFGEQVKAFGIKAGAQGDLARINLAQFQALISAKTLEWNGWETKVRAASAQATAAAQKSQVIMDGYRIGANAIEAKANMASRRWETKIREYEAQTNVTFTAAKYNSDSLQHAYDAQLDAAKVLLASGSQRLAGAWAMVGANASISGSASLTQTIAS